ncbi:hypothetical protein E3N88_23843 [Mikania micrantha]|uniref:Uncharacterized protein n=1 Tax=Mikania micrantha TaxID=192012 RepID=A0A5N6NEH3_9ASTR|nr:hypothetical protein E3N88_23843 [Mikania micrantha]
MVSTIEGRWHHGGSVPSDNSDCSNNKVTMLVAVTVVAVAETNTKSHGLNNQQLSWQRMLLIDFDRHFNFDHGKDLGQDSVEEQNNQHKCRKFKQESGGCSIFGETNPPVVDNGIAVMGRGTSQAHKWYQSHTHNLINQTFVQNGEQVCDQKRTVPNEGRRFNNNREEIIRPSSNIKQRTQSKGKYLLGKKKVNVSHCYYCNKRGDTIDYCDELQTKRREEALHETEFKVIETDVKSWEGIWIQSSKLPVTPRPTNLLKLGYEAVMEGKNCRIKEMFSFKRNEKTNQEDDLEENKLSDEVENLNTCFEALDASSKEEAKEQREAIKGKE